MGSSWCCLSLCGLQSPSLGMPLSPKGWRIDPDQEGDACGSIPSVCIPSAPRHGAGLSLCPQQGTCQCHVTMGFLGCGGTGRQVGCNNGRRCRCRRGRNDDAGNTNLSPILEDKILLFPPPVGFALGCCHQLPPESSPVGDHGAKGQGSPYTHPKPAQGPPIPEASGLEQLLGPSRAGSPHLAPLP